MDGLKWKTLLKWMIWGYPYFRNSPYFPQPFDTFEESCFSFFRRWEMDSLAWRVIKIILIEDLHECTINGPNVKY